MNLYIPTDSGSENLFESLCAIGILRHAFKMVKKNDGAAGIDRITIEEYEKKLEDNLEQLRRELVSLLYQPNPVRAVEIIKPAGGIRQLGIPCIKDRIIQTAIKILIEPFFEPYFSENSYGFRPKRNQQQAVQKAQVIVASGKEFIVDIDIAKYFDTINHDRLITRLGTMIKDKRILRLIGITLRSGIMKNGLVAPSHEGVTQGSPLSPLLSNIVLDELDKELEKRGLEFCRFADDCNVFARTRKAAERIMESVSKFLKNKLKLEINKEKSKVAKSDRVKFLGLTIIMATIAISAVSMNRAMDKVKELTPRGTSLTIEQTVTKINKWYAGWSSYYAMTQYPNQLLRIEAHIRRRLRARIIDQKKSKRNIYNDFVSRGVSRRLAKVAYSNRKRWALSHTSAAEKAYPNKWFTNTLKQKTRSNENRAHWSDLRKWVKLKVT